MRKSNKEDISTFQVAPRDQGQMVEVAYAATEGGYVRRTIDKSGPEVTYEFLDWDMMDDLEQPFEPWNGRVPEDEDGWEPAQLV